MDPNETLRQINEYADARPNKMRWQGIDEEAGHLCVAINEWLEKGGFEPDWKKYPDATAYFLHIYPCAGISCQEE
jgi:hypothetical protein